MVRVLAVAAFIVSISATARAQAPGDAEAGGPSTAPVVMVPPPPPQFVACGASTAAPVNVMANRFAVGLSVGSLSVAPKNAPSGQDPTQFGIGELSLRFRLTPHLELEGALGGGRETLKNGQQGDLEAHTGLLALRYRFMPAHRWNWWVMGGIGTIEIAQHDATDQEVSDQARPVGTFGVGIERRFHHFALQAELRALGIGQLDKAQATPVSGTTTMSTTANPPPPTSSTSSADQLSGGALTIGASYYF
jgi:hypothetical protein